MTIGWIGTSGGFKYLYIVENVIKELLKKYNNVQFLIVSNERPKFKSQIDYIFYQWEQDLEIQHFHEVDIGIMPLTNDEWSLGKCSYKMLLYMSCEIPVVVSSIGMNNEVLSLGEIGFGAQNNDEEWFTRLEYLIIHEDERIKMGKRGREVVVEYFSLEFVAAKLVSVVFDTINKN